MMVSLSSIVILSITEQEIVLKKKLTTLLLTQCFMITGRLEQKITSYMDKNLYLLASYLIHTKQKFKPGEDELNVYYVQAHHLLVDKHNIQTTECDHDTDAAINNLVKTANNVNEVSKSMTKVEWRKAIAKYERAILSIKTEA